VLTALARYDLQKMHAGTTGGIVWTFITPLIPLVVVSAIFAFGLRLPLGGAPYLFGFSAGFVPWVLLSGAVASATGSLVEHRYLIKRTRFPIEVVPAAATIIHSLPHAVLLLLVSALCLVAGYGQVPDLLAVVYFYACAVVVTVSAGLAMASLAVVARDLLHLLPALLQVWFWLTPIAWSSNVLPAPATTLLALNPARYIVAGYRYALMPRVFEPPSLIETATFWGVSLLLLLFGIVCFRRLRPYFWDCL
jgi:ABC-type polysaccharide/polyol phosphate export permease